MNTKLTLSIEQSVIDKAKQYARNKGRSLSDIIESYLKVVSNDMEINNETLTPTVKSLKGAFKAPETFNYKDELSNSLSEKYLK